MEYMIINFDFFCFSSSQAEVIITIPHQVIPMTQSMPAIPIAYLITVTTNQEGVEKSGVEKSIVPFGCCMVDTLSSAWTYGVTKARRRKKNFRSILDLCIKNRGNCGNKCIGSECQKNSNSIPLYYSFSTTCLLRITSRKDIIIPSYKNRDGSNERNDKYQKSCYFFKKLSNRRASSSNVRSRLVDWVKLD